MHPVAYIDLVAVLACTIGLGFLIFGRRRPGFSLAVPILLAVLLSLTTYYQIAQPCFRQEEFIVSYTNTEPLAKRVLIRCSAQRNRGEIHEVWTTFLE